MFWMYMALIVGSLVTAGAVLFTRSRIALPAAAAIAASAIVGYVLSRTTACRNATDDIGNWTEPLGLASLVVEGCVVAVALGALRALRPSIDRAADRIRLRRVRSAIREDRLDAPAQPHAPAPGTRWSASGAPR